MLLGLFTDSILKGEAEGAKGETPDPSEVEQGLRSLALEPRLSRRLLGSSVVDAMKTAEDKKADRFARDIVPTPRSADEKSVMSFSSSRITAKGRVPLTTNTASDGGLCYAVIVSVCFRATAT